MTLGRGPMPPPAAKPSQDKGGTRTRKKKGMTLCRGLWSPPVAKPSLELLKQHRK